MKKQFVTYEIALRLKELGFDEECIGFYYSYDYITRFLISTVSNINSHFEDNRTLSAPLWQQAIDWFREKYELYIVITVNPYSEVYDVNGYKIYDEKQELNCIINNEIQSWSYVFAREQAILKAIELISND